MNGISEDNKAYWMGEIPCPLFYILANIIDYSQKNKREGDLPT